MSLRQRLRAFGRWLARPAVWLTILAILLALIVWFVGPLLAFGDFRPLGSALVRLSAVLAIALAWGIAGVLMRRKRDEQEEALLGSLRRQQEEEGAEERRAEAAADTEFGAFRDGMRQALRLLRRAGGTVPFTGTAYQLPWYLLLGSHGAGKTTLVAHSGLSLPFGTQATADGAPGTVTVADQAVLIEVAGRMLTQPAAHEGAVWLRMLDHIRRQRARQPVNGILLVVAADELVGATSESSQDFAAAVRRRLDEAMARLRARAPVYVVISKLDHVPGFEEFFDALGAEERAAVLGLPLWHEGQGPAPGGADPFAAGFEAIVRRITAQIGQRLQEEPDEQRRIRIAEFPNQLSYLRALLEPLIGTLTAEHRFGAVPLIRGIFLVSATQDGQAVDALGKPLSFSFAQRAENLALPQEMPAAHARPYFLRGLFPDVLFQEASLGGFSRPATWIARARFGLANAALAALVVGLAILWWWGYSDGRAYSERLEAGISAARTDIAKAAEPGGATDFARVMQVLDDLKLLNDEAPQRAIFGLYSTASVDAAARGAYHRALNDQFLPFVMRYLESGLNDPATDPALLFQQLKFYLMLGGFRAPNPQTAALLGPDFGGRWMPYDRSPAAEAQLAAHLTELARVDAARQQTDPTLVEHARARIAQVTLARIAYDSMLRMPAVRGLAVWRPVDHMGMAGAQALARISKAGLWDGLPGFYTRTGFHDTLMPLSRTASDTLSEDLWVMGEAETLPVRTREAQRIREGIFDFYRVDYIRQWDGLLSDLAMVPSPTPGEAARALALIIGKPSPLKELVVAIAAETNLDPAANSPLAAAAATQGAGQVAAFQQRASAAGVELPVGQVDVGRSVTEHFKRLREAVSAEEGQQAQIDVMLAAFEPLYRQLNHVAGGGDILELGTEPQTTLNQLSEQIGGLPPSLQPVFRRILSQAAAVTGVSSRARLADIWNTTVLPVCQAGTEGRYPFDPRSVDDTSVDDFATLFGPKGVITAYRNDYLKPFIDTTTKPWNWRAGQQLGLGFPPEVLAVFERADDITTAFFGEADKPQVNFVFEALQLDPRAAAFQFDFGADTYVYTHGPPTPVPAQWPPANIGADASLSVTPELVGQRNVLRRQGTWALFRLFNAGRKLNDDPTDIVDYGFMVGPRKLSLRVTAPATKNPFAKDILAGFTCPKLE